ncbi:MULTISPECIES: hypothetical protein [unclassified Nocardioides]|uniref:hypothetical protein n=1 Tax=unclassified Nocardioides TaxID=2615069 RepID=UPI0030152392
MAATRVFISFDYDHDSDLKTLLVGQAKNSGSPFVIADWSIKVASTGWKEEARRRIRASDTVAIICGHHTRSAAGVAAELTLARDESIPYFLLSGRASGINQRPTSALTSDKVYDWTWPNLKLLIAGSR